MKNFSKYFFLGLGLLFICGCEAIQEVILTEPPGETDATPLRVTMIYPSDCVGDSAYCDSFHTGVKAAETTLGLTSLKLMGQKAMPRCQKCC